MVIEPTYRSPPYVCSPWFMTMVMALSVADIINGEMPSAMTEPKIAKSGFIVRRERRMPDFFEVRNRRTHAALNAWERTVASAAPETPM